ncbi:MAG: thiazole synthase [Alphaproteobacteria bacterium]|nr:thiazole synthase [Alphaproteobacteria bacterium]
MLTIGDTTLDSRLIVGTGKYPSFEVMRGCHEASGTALVTVAIRRVDLNAGGVASILDYIDRDRIQLLPNTAGCYTADEAVITARLARELLGTSLLKLEVIGDPKTLFPDIEGTLEAARVLVQDGFTVLPYCLDDPVSCQRLEEIGCAAVMPLAAPIGSGLGLRNPTNLALILEAVSVPVIVDAGLGAPSDATVALEMGCDAVLLNTAIAGAKDPVKMAHAFRLAVEAGRLSYEAGRIPKKLYASASSPLDGLIHAQRPA